MPNDPAPNRRIVVDGSNLATEGRTLPSLAQLEEAIQAFLEEFPGFRNADVIVVVDASFGHRIDESERAAFEEALAHGELVTPPAGAIGRGDAFILRIAEKAGALVLSNDSFQEFHAERPWLFETGRLIGGKPIPGVGWIFTPRTPVRGAVSRATTSRAKKAAATDEDVPASPPARSGGRAIKASGSTKKSGGRRKASVTASDLGSGEQVEGASIGAGAGRDGGAGPGDDGAGGDGGDGAGVGGDGTGAGAGAGAEAPKKAGSTVKKAGGRAKKAATADKAGPASKTGAVTKSAAKAAKTTKAAKATKAATGSAKAAAEPAKGTGKTAKAAAKAAKTTKGTASKRGGATEPADVDHDEGGGSPIAGKRPGATGQEVSRSGRDGPARYPR